VIGQYLSNKNENATVAKNQNFCELNKASVFAECDLGPALGKETVCQGPRLILKELFFSYVLDVLQYLKVNVKILVKF